MFRCVCVGGGEGGHFGVKNIFFFFKLYIGPSLFARVLDKILCKLINYMGTRSIINRIVFVIRDSYNIIVAKYKSNNLLYARHHEAWYITIYCVRCSQLSCSLKIFVHTDY